MVSALDFQSLILSSIPGGNRSFLLSLHPLRLSHRIINFSTLLYVVLLSMIIFVEISYIRQRTLGAHAQRGLLSMLCQQNRCVSTSPGSHVFSC